MSVFKLKGFHGSGSMLLSLLFVAAILPVALMGVLNPDGLRLTSRADQPSEMRVWLEPAEVVTKPGVKMEFTVMGNFDSETRLIPEFKATIKSDKAIEVKGGDIVYKEPFRGEVTLGKIEAIAKEAGQYEIKVDEGSVFLILPDIPVISAKALIISRK